MKQALPALSTRSLVALVTLLALACGSDDPAQTLTLGPAGGELSAGDAHVTFPEDALTTDTELTLGRISQRDVAALGPNEQFTGAPYLVAPADAELESPVTIVLPYSGDDADLFVFAAPGLEGPWRLVRDPVFENGRATFSTSTLGVFVVVRAFSASLSPLPATPRFVVVNSDRSSAAISMLNAQAEAIDAEWFTSGDALSGLVAALGSDVTLPTTFTAGHIMVLDRFRVDVLTNIAIPGGEIVGQLRTHERAVTTGFSSNPQDYLELSATSGWVSRFGANLDEAAPATERGSDLIEIDPSTMQRTGRRVDLTSFTQVVDDTDVHPRPSRMLAMGGRMVIGLGLLSSNFRASSEGVLVVVDPSDLSVTSLALSGLRNCGTLVPVPGDATRAMVACIGHSPTYDEAEVRATAGVVVVHMSDAHELVEEARWEVAADEGAGASVYGHVALSDDEFVAVAYGNRTAGTNDVLYRVVISTGEQTQLAETAGQHMLGTLAFDPMSDLLLVPDAATGLRRFTLTGDGASEGGTVALTMPRGLPPRHAYLLAP